MMFVIQSGDGTFRGQYLMGFIGSLPVWTDILSEAAHYDSVDDTAQPESKLERNGYLCYVIPA